MPNPGRGSHQIFDQANNGNGQSIAASATATVVLAGTTWPLLPDAAYRIFAVSADWVADVPAVLNAISIQLLISLQDNAGTQQGVIYLKAQNFTTPAPVGAGAGFALAADGDPLVEFFSNLNLTGQVSGRVSKFAVQYIGEFHNIDAANPHVMAVSGTALFSTQV